MFQKLKNEQVNDRTAVATAASGEAAFQKKKMPTKKYNCNPKMQNIRKKNQEVEPIDGDSKWSGKGSIKEKRTKM